MKKRGQLTNATVRYLSTATSTFIVRVARTHYRLVWATLSFMKHVPVWNGISIADGRPCIFRVVRVSGTMRKVEEEAIRRAKLLVLAAKDEIAGKSSNTLDNLFGGKDRTARNLTMVEEQEDQEMDDGEGYEES
jgi:ribonuclease P/MRP protein subunit POP5